MPSNKTRGEIGSWAQLGDWLGIGLLVVSSCFHLHQLFFLGFISISLILFFLLFLQVVVVDGE